MNKVQKSIYQIYRDNNGKFPPYRQLAKIIGVSSTNTIAYHINKLREEGYLNLSNESNGIVKLTIKNLIDFSPKSGVYVILKNKDPFYIGESNNMQKHLIGNILENDGPVLSQIKENLNAINIAYYIINEISEKEILKNHLIEFYKSKGFEPLS